MKLKKKIRRGRRAFIWTCTVEDALYNLRGTIEKLILAPDRESAMEIARGEEEDFQAHGGRYSDQNLSPVMFFGYRFKRRPNRRHVLQWDVKFTS